jgi:acetylornithine deacetylase/succinyl-diaminopimelate desuccinylase-like protein
METNELRSRLTELMPQVRRDLEDLVRIQSVSADPARKAEVQRSADAVAELLRAEGFEEVKVVTAADDGFAPAVLAKLPAQPGQPTVLLYAHHDVQPENDPAEWDSPPWEPTERNGRLYGRGAADDKAGIMAHIAAIRALGDDLRVGVTMFIEGEEEVASATLPALLDQHQDYLRCDTIVIADSGNWDIGVPALTTTLRGAIRCDLEIRTMTHAVHSGMWGGLVPDALMTLARVISSLYDESGGVAVAGLHSGPAEDVDYPEARLRAESGALPQVDPGSARAVLWRGCGPSPRSPSRASMPPRSTEPATP